MSEHSAPNFCSHCGTRLGADDAYCSQCGAAIGGSGRRFEPRARRTESDEGRAAFRRRRDELLAEGWEIEHQSEDRIVLANRGIGSIGVHVLLLLFTGGIGNLLYGWYSYSPNAERVELHADGTRRRLNGSGSSETEFDREAVDWLFSAFFAMLLLFLGFMFLITGTSLTAAAVGLACLLGAIGVLPPARRRLAARRSVGTFGRVRETHQRVVDRPDEPCAACAAPVGQGVERRYGERTYAAGIPLWGREHGRNAYCRDCASGESSDEQGAKRVIEVDHPERARVSGADR